MAEFEYSLKKIAGDLLDSGDPETVAGAHFETDREYSLGADADGAFSAVPLGALDNDYNFVGASLASSVTVTGATDAYWTLSILKYDASGANGTTIASLDSQATITAKTSAAFTLVAGAEALVEGGYLELVGNKATTGQSLGASRLTYKLRRRSA